MTGTFAHDLHLDRIRDGDRIDLAADDAQRIAIARRLGLESLDRLEGHAVLSRNDQIIRARGRVQASLAQSCVVTGESIASHVDEPFDILFMPEPAADGADEEIELAEADCDVMFHDGARIDLGAAIADTLALSIDPYPRSAGADAALKEAGIMTEAEASPFAALAQLRKNDDS